MVRLKMQSPQKLRERVQTNQKAMEAAGASFQEEMAKITEEIRISRTPATSAVMAPLETQIEALSKRHTDTIADMSSRLAALDKDVDSSLKVSEARFKKLDELWRETSAENEILYSRFNDELAKLMNKIKQGDGVEDLIRRFAESQEENARLKRENWKLKREVVGLKAQLREG